MHLPLSHWNSLEVHLPGGSVMPVQLASSNAELQLSPSQTQPAGMHLPSLQWNSAKPHTVGHSSGHADMRKPKSSGCSNRFDTQDRGKSQITDF